MKPTLLLLAIALIFLGLLSACTPVVGARLSAAPIDPVQPAQTMQVNVTVFWAASVQPLAAQTTALPVKTVTPDAGPLPSSTPELPNFPEWVWNPPGEVIAPILLYHRIAETKKPTRYTVSPEAFLQQMEWLQEQGYYPITPSKLVDALDNGAMLPERPILITFDDGYLDVYEEAFPAMKAAGWPGTVYLIGNQVGKPGHLGPAEIADLVLAGWEVGSHSLSHANLRQSRNKVEEIASSRTNLEELLLVPVETFAYPYGAANDEVIGLAQESGYLAAMGLGITSKHTIKTQFFLSRREVRGEYGMKEFEKLLR